MKLVLTGGGTGGHIYPAIAIAEACTAESAFAPLGVLFIGARDRLEAQIVPKAGYDVTFVKAAPLARDAPLRAAGTVLANVVGFVQALSALHRARPDVLVATGGYVAFPVVAALALVRALGRSKARIAVLETNASPGLTNRLVAPLADEVWYAIAPSDRALHRNEYVVGIPLRAALTRPMDAREGRLALGLRAELTTIVVMGGSQGARSLNDAAAALVTAGLPDGWQMLIVAGAREIERLRGRMPATERARIVGYLDDPRAAYAAADIVVARAGASTLGELAATGAPAILIPYPYATGDHQTQNARTFAASGAARVIPDDALDAGRLRRELAAALVPATLEGLRTAVRALGDRDPRAAIVARVKNWAVPNRAIP